MKKYMVIDLSGATSKAAVHAIFKEQLGFPDWYGVSWDAFWDAIIAVVEMPEEVTLINWQAFSEACPRDMEILRRIIQDYAEEVPTKRLSLA
ncbi:MAG: barstar family protein [Janthinobacterium lividum]